MMTRQQKRDYGTQWRRDHGIQPKGARKSRKILKRRAPRLREMTWLKLGHEPISGKWIDAVNEKLQGD